MSEKEVNSSQSTLERANSLERTTSYEGGAPLQTLATPTGHEVSGKDEEKADKSTPNPWDPEAFPDGGTQAWSVVMGAWCALFLSFGWINCLGVFQTYYESNILSEYSPSAIAWIGSIQVFLMFMCSPFLGIIFDNYGPRLTVLIGSFFHVLGLMMTSLSKEYYQVFLAQGVCTAIGTAALFYMSIASTSTWFFKRRALALGIVVSGSSIGGVVLPIMLQQLIPKIGFPWAMRSIAFMFLGILVIVNLTVKSRLEPRPKTVKFIAFISPLKELSYALLCLSTFLYLTGLFLPLNYIILQAIDAGMKPKLAQYLLSILNAASCFGRILPGWLADRYGRVNTTFAIGFFTGVITLALWLPTQNHGAIIAFAALYGFGSGGFVSLLPAVVNQLSDIREIGARMGLLYAMQSVAALIGTPIGGALISNEGGKYTHLQIFTGVTILGGSAVMFTLRTILSKGNMAAKV